jgi:hypothetical protein
MKPHIKVIQRNGVDIFVTSSATMKETVAEKESHELLFAHLEKERFMVAPSDLSRAGMQAAINQRADTYSPFFK